MRMENTQTRNTEGICTVTHDEVRGIMDKAGPDIDAGARLFGELLASRGVPMLKSDTKYGYEYDPEFVVTMDDSGENVIYEWELRNADTSESNSA